MYRLLNASVAFLLLLVALYAVGINPLEVRDYDVEAFASLHDLYQPGNFADKVIYSGAWIVGTILVASSLWFRLERKRSY